MAGYTNSPDSSEQSESEAEAEAILISQFIGPRFRQAITKRERTYPFHCPHCRQAGYLIGFPSRTALRAHLLTHQPLAHLTAFVSA